MIDHYLINGGPKRRYSGVMKARHLIHLQDGFSLVELAIVLVIFGGIAAMSLTLGYGWLDQERFNTSKVNIQTIEMAIDEYRKRNNRLPCPADLTMTNSNANFGVEASNPGACTGGAIVATTTTSANVVFGAIPATTLGIGKNVMQDNWGRLFVYYVDTRLTAEDALDERAGGYIAMTNAAVGDIVVQDATGANRTNKAVYAILSHGKNGHGGYLPANGVRLASVVGADAAEAENCNCDDTATTTGVAPYDNDNVLVQSMLGRTFDDIVVYRERSQLFNKVER